MTLQCDGPINSKPSIVVFVTCNLYLFILFAFVGHAFAGQQEHTSPGAATYKSNCVLCHGSDGSGNTPLGKQLQVGDLRESVPKMSEADLLKLVREGRGKMPAYSDQMSDKQIDDVIKYVRTLSKASR